MRPTLACIFIFCTILRLCAGAEPIDSRQESAGSDSAEAAWQSLRAKFPRQRSTYAQAAHAAPRQQSAATVESIPITSANARNVQGSQPQALRRAQTDWQALARESREFITRYPDGNHVSEARKLELTAELIPSRGRGRVSPEIQSRIDACLADPSLPATERYDVSAMSKEARLELRAGMRMEDVMGRRLENARELAAEFPADPRAWTTMLGSARRVSMQTAAEVAGQIVNSAAAPEDIKHNAQRLLDKYVLMGKSVEGIDLTAAAGRPTLIYFWTCEKPLFLDFLRHCEKIEGVAFIGINVDADEGAAREFAARHSLPGEQFYRGMESSSAILHFTDKYFPALLVDRHGVLQEAGGFMDTREKLKRMAVESPMATADVAYFVGKRNLP